MIDTITGHKWAWNSKESTENEKVERLSDKVKKIKLAVVLKEIREQNKEDNIREEKEM